MTETKPSSQAQEPRRVKARFITPLALVLIFIMGVFAAAILLVETRIHDDDIAERTMAVEKLFVEKLNKDTNLMTATMRAMMTNQAIERAFQRRDRAALSRQVGPLFANLRDNHRITHLYFTGPDLINLYRFHSPDEFGDEIDRVTALKSKERLDAVHGLELGPLGTLTLRLVIPWRRDGRVLGYLEIGEEIEHLIDEIHESLSVDMLVLVDKRMVSLQQWQRGQALMKRDGNWDRFASHAALAQTIDELPSELDDATLRQLLAGRTARIEDRGRSLHLALVPLTDVGQRHIGDLVVMRDITGLVTTFRWSIFAVTAISMLSAIGVLVAFYLALDRVESDYRRKHDLEHQLLRFNAEYGRILQLEKLSALGTMVGGIAHQLNNPLVGVVNLAQLAEREADNPARTRELLQEIRGAGEDCRSFIKRMLAFSKVSCFDSKPTPMADLIEDTVLLFRQTENKHLPIETTLPEQPVALTVDPILIRHALFNLLVNAAQATSDNGAIRISLEREDDPVRKVPGWSLAVTDHGRGMAPEVMEKIFVPFYTTRSDGTGLGLPVVQHVALLHDGQVSASSEPGHGTRIAIWLPDGLPEGLPDSLSDTSRTASGPA
ncbi:MAG: ATP-binding protein [Sulfuritalea sp.]|nr:ATP-binding protein [Sulfuritalea sp.]MDP1982590.1 ATP-binding protein [Sulfuritalea sp.]